MSMVPFTKMHGAGNDFVVIDQRAHQLNLSAKTFAVIADRHRGIGCDQIISIESSQNGADVRFRFHNADGSEAGTCGNGARCAASKVMDEDGTSTLSIETHSAILSAERAASGEITIDMGPAHLDWKNIPLSKAIKTCSLPSLIDGLAAPIAVGIGNPHCVFFVDDAEAIEIELHGPIIEHHPLFPERTNVEFVSLLDGNRMRLRVWERGVGVTLACGSGVCAVVVAAIRRRLIKGRSAEIVADGGILSASWREDGNVLLTGPVATSFLGTFGTSLI
ncbi:MAG: diaminopimelate epimerase [Rickettsiales bacterium]|jgi:diaminopimelate epimerase|nr:diaminopimelate epimerase [Rickettsiales bacterium]|tara:strand:- start:62 stop:892 length:831 start_codon:yes stop_codon:yes gene_type:complete